MDDGSKMTNTTTSVITKRLLFIVLGMFGFGFAMVPLYDVFCAVTGFNGKTSGRYIINEQMINEQMANEQMVSGQRVSEETEAVAKRTVTVQFLANNNGSMPWDFRAGQRTLTVQPGEMNATEFYARNTTDRTMTAQAIPSVTPFRAAEYLHKTECFCFTQQTLAAGEELSMPLRFILADELPQDVKKLTLSYTLYDVTAQMGAQAVTQKRIAVRN